MLKNFVMGANQVLRTQAAARPMTMASSIMGNAPMRQFRQVNNLHEIVYTA